MTAPNVAPVVTPVAPATPAPDAETIDQSFDPGQLSDQALVEFVGLAEPQADGDVAPPSNEAQSDAAADKALDNALAEPTPEPVVAATPATPAVPATPAEPAKKPLYVAYGEDGKPIDALPVKEFEITVGGKTKRVTPDVLARMASSGGYNEQLQDEVKQARELVPQVQTQLQQWQDYAQRLDRERQSILADPDYYLRQVEAYAAEQAPSARADRAEQQNRQLQQQLNQAQATQYIQQQAEQVILPKLDAIITKHPNVQPAELIAQFETLIRPYKVAGQPLAPQFLPHVLDIIDRAIEPYAAQLHDVREESKQAKALTTVAASATQSAETATQQAQATATKAKADVSRTIAPVGRVAARPTPKPQPVKTANEGADRALEDALTYTFSNLT